MKYIQSICRHFTKNNLYSRKKNPSYLHRKIRKQKMCRKQIISSKKRKYSVIIQCKVNKTKLSVDTFTAQKKPNTIEQGLFWNCVIWYWKYVEVLMIWTFRHLQTIYWKVNRTTLRNRRIVNAAQRLFWALTAQRMKFFAKVFFSKCDQICWKLQNLAIFTEEIVNGKLYFLCSDRVH